MRHTWIDFTEGLHKGLRIYPELGRREGWPRELYNFTVGVGGVEAYEAITKLFESYSPSWPFPKVVFGYKKNLFLLEDKIYTFDADYNLSLELSTSSGNLWEVTDYYDYMVLTNGSNIYYLDPSDGTFKEYSPDDSIPLFGTGCDFRGQGFIGNISNWNSMDSASIAWSRIGEYNFSPGTRNEANFTRAPWDGEIYRLRPLGDSVVAYGDGGILALVPHPSAPHVGRKTLPSNGLASRYAIEGDEHLHIFIDSEGFVWKVSRDLLPKRIGYQEYMNNLDLSKILVSFDSLYRQFYISDGSRAYLLTSYGMSEVYQCPTSVYARKGFVSVENSIYAKVLVSRSDMGMPGQKVVTAVTGDSTASSGVSALAINENDLELEAAASPEGFGCPKLAGQRLGIGMKFENFSSANLVRLRASIIHEGKTAIRGDVNA
jgi:hypothetical protein